jgi:hypothetical protein
VCVCVCVCVYVYVYDKLSIHLSVDRAVDKKKLRETQINGKISYTHGLEESILLKYLYY